MRGLILYLVLFSSLLFADKGFDTKPFIEELQKRYAKEIKGLKFKEASDCKDIKGSDSCILYLEYKNSDEFIYTLSLAIAVIDKEKKSISKSYFHQDITDSDAIYIDDIEFDTTLYKKNILSLYISYYGSSRVNPYSSQNLFMYGVKNSTLKLILENLELDSSQGENDMCSGYDTSHKYKFKNRNSFKFREDMIFTHSYNYTEYFCKDSSKEDEWNVELEPLKLIYKNGKYQSVKKEKPIFDLKQIEKNAKKGLGYKEIVLKAMLYENPIIKSNIEVYNNIAYYLQENTHNKEAILLLERIIEKYPNRVVAYLNLGDAYLAIANSFHATKYYTEYIEQMQKEGKFSKIPQRIKSIIKNQNNFENNFVQVHKKKESISPLILTKQGVAKVVSIVPWKQKVVYEHDKSGLLLRVVAYEKEEKIEYIFFVLTLNDKFSVNGSTTLQDALISVYQLKDNSYKPFLLNSYSTNIIVDEDRDMASSIANWNSFNRQAFDFFKNHLYFDVKSCMSNPSTKSFDAFCYQYKYIYGDDNVTKENEYMTKNWYKKWNHQRNQFVYDGGGISLGKMINAKKIQHQEFEADLQINQNIVDVLRPFNIGNTTWSKDDKVIYFDNHEIAIACIWRYDIESKELSKIVPEHEASSPFAFHYKGKEYVVYIEGNKIKVATAKDRFLKDIR